MFIITATFIDDSGNVRNTSSPETLGHLYGIEFTTEMDAGAAKAELEGDEARAGITYTVEDIGITAAEVASKSGDEWWSLMVGRQTPAEFMALTETSSVENAMVDYFVDFPRDVATFHNEDAKSALADKLAEYIESSTTPHVVDEVESSDTDSDDVALVVGQVVRLVSGGLAMTVTNIIAPKTSHYDYTGHVECTWFERPADVPGGNLENRRWFPVVCLDTGQAALGLEEQLAKSDKACRENASSIMDIDSRLVNAASVQRVNAEKAIARRKRIDLRLDEMEQRIAKLTEDR